MCHICIFCNVIYRWSIKLILSGITCPVCHMGAPQLLQWALCTPDWAPLRLGQLLHAGALSLWMSSCFSFAPPCLALILSLSLSFSLSLSCRPHPTAQTSAATSYHLFISSLTRRHSNTHMHIHYQSIYWWFHMFPKTPAVGLSFTVVFNPHGLVEV